MLPTLHTVITRWRRDEAALLAAAVSYYIALSLFPVMLILTSGLGAFFKWTHSGNNAREYLLKVIGDQVTPSLASAIEQSLGHIEDYSPLSGPIGMAILLFSALAIFAQFERAFDRVWNVRTDERLTALASVQRMFTYRLRAFAMLCGLGLLVLAVFAIGLLIAAAKRRLDLDSIASVWWVIEFALPIGINALAFSALYRFLPKRPVRWKDAARGGLLAAIIWEIGLQLIATFVIGQHYSSAYGIIGCFLAIMLWGYYAVAVIFFGAEFVQVLGENASSDEREVISSARSAAVDGRSAEPPRRTEGRDANSGQRRDEKHSGVALGAVVIRRSIGSRFKSAWRIPSITGRVFDISLAALLIYVALFLGLRHFRSAEIALETNAAMQRVVRFSDSPWLHQFGLRVFAPLIASLPGPYHYPPAAELRVDSRGQALSTSASRPSSATP